MWCIIWMYWWSFSLWILTLKMSKKSLQKYYDKNNGPNAFTPKICISNCISNLAQFLHSQVDKAKLWNAIKNALINLIVMNLSWHVIIYPIQMWAGCSADPAKIPNIFVFLRDMVIIVISNDILFYYTHRLVNSCTSGGWYWEFAIMWL